MSMRFHRVRQQFPRPRVDDVTATVREQMAASGVAFTRDAHIAVAAGSRGIANIDRITRAVVDVVREDGARPFIVPAMGSHGGATAEGQTAVLASYGITEETMGCPVRSSMDVVELPSDGLEHPLYMDRNAWESDGVILINRVKLHTDFHGPYESGLVKMAVIGLGKERQASTMHQFGVRGLRDLVPEAAKKVLDTGKILLGIGLVENAYDETATITAIPGKDLLQGEPALLEQARTNMPSLPVDEIDLLVVDFLGKDVSGTGFDTNIIGRIKIAGEADPESPRIRMILVRDLTPASHGNATGIGLADVTLRRLLDKIDFATTYKNILTSGFLERAKVPYVCEDEAEALKVALRGAGCIDPDSARIVRIRDTLHLSELIVSEPVADEVGADDRDETPVDLWADWSH